MTLQNPNISSIAFKPCRSAFSFLLVVFFLLLQGVSYAQMQDIPTSFRWGSLQKAPKKSRLAKIVYAHKGGVLILRYQEAAVLSKERFWLERFDQSLRLVAKDELLINKEEHYDIEDVVQWNQQLYIIYSELAQEQSAHQVWMQPIALNGQVVGEKRLIAELEAGEKYRRRQFHLEFDQDSTHMLVYNQLAFQKDGPERFTLRVYNQDLSLKWSKDVVLNYRDANFRVREYRVDAQGHVYVLGQRRREQNGQRLSSVYSLYAYINDGKKEQIFEFDRGDARFHHLKFKVQDKDHLALGGVYASKSNKDDFGLCHIQVNVSEAVVDFVHVSPFLKDSIDQNHQASNYRLKDLILRSDGGLVLIAEQHQRNNQRTYLTDGVINETLYQYNNILVANMAPEGHFSWIKSIPKMQITANDGGAFSSFARAIVKDRFYFVFNEHPENFSPLNNKITNLDHLSSVVSLVETKRNGEQNVKPLFVNKDYGIITRPRLCRQISARSILLYGQYGREFRLGLLTFD